MSAQSRDHPADVIAEESDLAGWSESADRPHPMGSAVIVNRQLADYALLRRLLLALHSIRLIATLLALF